MTEFEPTKQILSKIVMCVSEENNFALVDFRCFDNLNTSYAFATFDAIDDTKAEQIEGILIELNSHPRKEFG